jgi:type V secretory pathway adhesin AidA
MPYINPEALDGGLDYIVTNGTRIDLCFTQEPVTYLEATTTYTCGNKAGMTVTSPEDGSVDGRKVSVPAITDGAVSATQTAGFWALTDGASVLVATGALASSQAVTSGNTFTLDAISIALRGAVSV